jgi:hypothetical protein
MQQHANSHNGSESRAVAHEHPSSMADGKSHHSPEVRSFTPPVQRQVRNVNWNTNNVEVPGQQILSNFGNITEINVNQPTLTNKVTGKFKYIGTADQVVDVVGTTKAGRPNGNGAGTSHTAKIGQIGRDEFLLKRGVDQSEAFEGGHLIGKALWDANDADVGSMNKSENLVPMSRGLNIYDYADQIEEAMGKNAWRRWTIAPVRSAYKVPEKHLAELLGLPLKNGMTGDNQLDFTAWIPDRVTAQQGGVVKVAPENPLLSPFVQVDDGPGLVQLLQQTRSWNYLTDQLQQQVTAL